MCGIAGFIDARRFPAEEGLSLLRRMTDTLLHRGPDDSGYWLDPSLTAALGHRRLSIVDLSPAGHQPMASTTGRYVVVFNGEIYNHRQLRGELQSRSNTFRGNSDTEVLLLALETWGPEETLARIKGMFAFAAWDRVNRELFLSRDRFGEKPLYYCLERSRFSFGSEARAVVADPSVPRDIDRDALAAMLRFGCIAAPASIYRAVRKLMPGHWLRVKQVADELMVTHGQYWAPRYTRDSLGPRQATPEPAHALEAVHDALTASIRDQMVADVPVGAFLSGGVDSSLVVAIMQASSSQPIRTFSIGFSESEFDESPHARAISKHLGTAHTELILDAATTLEMVPRIATIYDEPFADSSQIPTALVAQLARASVTVSLSGDAGDELFCGYNAYPVAQRRWSRIGALPHPVRQAGLATALGLPAPLLRSIGSALGRARGRPFPYSLDKMVRESAEQIRARDFGRFYWEFMSLWPGAESVVIGADPAPERPDYVEQPNGRSAMSRMMHADIRRYLPDDILVKVDRAAMAFGLETRIPFLSEEVADAAWSIPVDIHCLDGRGKWVLRSLLERYVPRPLFDRPKQGFAVPVARWLRSDLRPWAEELLDLNRLRREGFFDACAIRNEFEDHLSGSVDRSSRLWSVLMFQNWLDSQRT